jgi:hypothetical protein
MNAIGHCPPPNEFEPQRVAPLADFREEAKTRHYKFMPIRSENEVLRVPQINALAIASFSFASSLFKYFF